MLQLFVQPHLILEKGQQPGRQWVPTCQPEVTQLAVLGRGDPDEAEVQREQEARGGCPDLMAEP